MAHPTSFDSGGGLSAGETTFGELNCMGTMDKAFQTLFGKTAKGTVLDEVKITGCKMGDKQMDYFEITLTKALCSALNVSSGGDELMVSYSFVSTKIKVEYWLQAEDGGQGASSPQEWDVKANK
jgi:type VI protein secretion system component Hcp